MSEDATTEAPKTIEALKPAMALEGTVKRIELYGAFVDIGIGKDALLHISQLGKKVRDVKDVLNVDDKVTVYVLKVDKDAGRIALSLTKPAEVGWDQLSVGTKLKGTVTRIEKFGVFVDIGAERAGMVHVSELTDGFVQSPDDVVSLGEEVEVRVIKLDRRKRQIDLSMKEEAEPIEMIEEDAEEIPTAMELAFRKAMDSNGDAEAAKAARKNRKQQRREEQDDIISRTLRLQEDQ